MARPRWARAERHTHKYIYYLNKYIHKYIYIYRERDVYLGELGDEEEDVRHPFPRDGRGGHERDGPREVVVGPVEGRVERLRG